MLFFGHALIARTFVVADIRMGTDGSVRVEVGRAAPAKVDPVKRCGAFFVSPCGRGGRLGVAVNPEVVIVMVQIEGSIGFALSKVLRSEITLRSGIVQQSNFDDYKATRIREMPKVEVHIVPSTEAPTGIWKPGLSPVAPAIGNAVAAAAGKRLDTLPLGLTTLSG
jgi:hypothetical protein